MITNIIWWPRQFQCNSWPEIHSRNKGYILLSLLPSGAQDFSLNYFHRSGNEFYLCKSLHNSPVILFWIHTTFSTSLVSSLKYSARVSNSREEWFFFSGQYKISYYHLAWLVNINRATARSWPGSKEPPIRQERIFLPPKCAKSSAWYLGSMQNIHNSLFDDRDKEKNFLQSLWAEVGCPMSQTNTVVTASLHQQHYSCSLSMADCLEILHK